MEQVSSSPSLQRAILRLVQTNGTIERSALGMRSRSYDQENWEAVLNDLVERGLVTEAAEIRVGEKSMRGQKRAVIVYHLTVLTDLVRREVVDTEFPDFGKLSVEEVQAFVAKFPKREPAHANA